MLEDQVAYLLQRYLGNYVQGLNKEALKISAWRGDVELTNMQLKPEALNALKLPVRVKAGFLGSVKLKVPWSRLGQEPVFVFLDQILILAEPATHVEGCSEDAMQEIKRSRVRDIEMKLIESQQQLKSEMNSSWIGSFINTIIGNLKLSISNVHIRYEDLESNPGHPFAAGLTLQKLSAMTVDDFGIETFATGGALERIQKSVELECLAFYFDSDVCPWNVDKPWKDMFPSEWIQMFEVGKEDGQTKKVIPSNHSYILQPVSGNARYIKLHVNETRNAGQPIQKALVNLDDVILCLSKDGYRDILKMADNFSAFNQRLKYAHYRPTIPIQSDPRSWWKYGYKAVVNETKKASGRFSWEQVLKYARLRKRYVTLYASLLRSDLNQRVADDNEEIKTMDRELDIEVILQWRMLAHKFLDQLIESGSHLEKQKASKSWWSGWSTSGNDDESKGFTDEDWERLNKMIGYKEDPEEQSISRARVDMLLSFFEIHMKHNASRLVTDGNSCLADLSCDGMVFSLKMYPETTIFDLKLGSYRLLSPQGLLAESETVSDSLVCSFSYKPFDSELDWSFVAKASPCYVTYLKDIIDEIISFFKHGTAISQTIALETASVVQVTLDEVKRTAHQQVTRALKDHARFSLDLDIAAPKITIPTKFKPDNLKETKLLLDLGNLMLSTQDSWELSMPSEKDIYLQFNVILSDVSAFLVDGDHSWNKTAHICSSSSDQTNIFLPVIEKCMIVLSLQQVLLENPLYPSMRISVRLPSLGFYFSPARYHRLMQVAKIFQEENTEDGEMICPWSNADIEGWVSLLSWKGMANREAIWQTRFLSLVGPFLYVLDSPASKTYKQYISLRGKQVYQLPSEFTGDEHVVAVFDCTHPTAKVMEDANALVVRFDSSELRKTWQNRLQGAIYRASGSAAVASLAEISSSGMMVETSGGTVVSNKGAEKLFLTGVLDELKICCTCSYQHGQSFSEILLVREKRLFELRAIGGQVELSIKGNDLFVGTILKSLEIEDQFMRGRSSIRRYLARSFIRTTDATAMTAFSAADNGSQNIDNERLVETDAEELFFEASDSLGDSADSYTESEENIAGVGTGTCAVFAKVSVKPPSFSRMVGLLPDSNPETELKLTDMLDSFVKVQMILYHQDSQLYNSIDTWVSVTLATLSFFCHRPTIIAILNVVNAINAEDERGFGKNETTMTNAVDNINSDMTKEPVLRGLLGKGKSRVLFYLSLNMARAEIFLVIEDGFYLATLLQNDLLCKLKVFPSSFSIKAALGNLKISDDSLPSSHAYFWMCDMRDPRGTSFVELDFTSFCSEDDDYQGYDYSLVGHFSELRIIYLNRFVQEVASYFGGLVPSNSRVVVNIKDQVSNVEKSFTMDEIEGSPALKLDVSLNKPIILMPRRTDSPDYLELDVLHITIANTFQWVGGDKNEMNAVHLETLAIQVKEINITVGSGGTFGENIIKDVRGLSIIIHRSLRDLLHNIPMTEVVVKVNELKAALSNQEYQIITECAVSNMSEDSRTLPKLELGFVAPRDDTCEFEHFPDLDVAEIDDSQRNPGWISLKASVDIDLIELHLLSGRTRDAPLASIQAIGAWLLYKTNSYGESFLWATLKGFNVIDDREGTKDEFRHAIARHEHVGALARRYEVIGKEQDSNDLSASQLLMDEDSRNVASMLILDVMFKKASTNVSLFMQRPHLLVALDFLLAIAEFFVPSVRAFLTDEGDEDPVNLYDAIILDESIYYQPSAEFSLSPRKPLVVDHDRYDHYIYDGRGGSLCLKDSYGADISWCNSETIFYVGNGKRLQFKNVVIKNGEYLDSCVFLGSSSSYSASEDDGVFLEGAKSPNTISAKSDEVRGLKRIAEKPVEMEYLIEIQAIGPEFTFYNNLKDVGESWLLANKLLHAELDLSCRLILKGDSTEITGEMMGFRVESNGIRVLEPFDTSIKLSNVSGRKNISLAVSDIFMNFSYNLMMLFLAVEEDILTFVRMTSKKISLTCSQFDKVGTIIDNNGKQKCAFWRPRAPPGFAILGDCVTPWNEPPSMGVLAVNTSFIRVKRPLSYKLIWPPSDWDEAFNEADIKRGRDVSASASTDFSKSRHVGCSIWFPVAPQGYVALGCVVSSGREEPPLSSAMCILASLMSSCSMRDCISLHIDQPCPSKLACWRVENAFGSFLASDSSDVRLSGMALELRHLIFGILDPSANPSTGTNLSNTRHNQANQLQRSAPLSSGRLFEAVASFIRVWSNEGAPNQKKLSIWRPITPEGMFYFGDIAVPGYEPPSACFVLRDTRDDSLVKPPIDFHLVGQIRRYKKLDNLSLWLPQAPPGYVPLGCIASKSPPKQRDFSSLRCIRSDMVASDQFPEESMWDSSNNKISREPFSIWSVGGEVGTFIVRRGLRRPPKRFALKLADLNESGNLDSTVVDAQIKTLSAAVYDDYGGLMVPLFNISLTGIGFNLHGRSDYMNSTVSFTLTGRSYNDKHDTWEPLIEPVDGFLRYQYDSNAPGAVSQLRIASTRDLNLNISTSNINMLLQAYSSWNNLNDAHESLNNRELLSPAYSGQSILDVNHKRDYYIIPQNKLGREIYIRATEMRRYSSIIKMPAGDNKPIKVPVSKNLLDLHLLGKDNRVSRSMVTIIIYSAELAGLESLNGQITTAIRVFQESDSGMTQQQSARTCGTDARIGLTPGLFLVDWSEIFFFRADCLDTYMVEFVVTDLGTGKPVGFYSSPLASIAFKVDSNLDSNNQCSKWTWRELTSAKFVVNQRRKDSEKCGRIKCAVIFPAKPANKLDPKSSPARSKSGFLQISPAKEGPWTTVRLNYATSAACWRLGNDVISSELTVKNGTRYVNIRSLVSVTNNTDFDIALCLKSKEGSKKFLTSNLMDHEEGVDTSFYETDVFFETEKYIPLVGWVTNSSSLPSPVNSIREPPLESRIEGISSLGLPSGWEWVDDWHIDNSTVKDSDGWVYASDVGNLRWPESFSCKNSVCKARQRRWTRLRKYVFGEEKNQMPLNLLKSGDTIPLPLQAVVHPVLSFFLQLQPILVDGHHEYSWSDVRMRYSNDRVSDNTEESLELCVSALSESQIFVYCSEVNGNHFDSSSGLWFCLSIQPVEIGKDVHLDPIHDWKIVISSPLSITNYLPLPAEYSLLRMQPSREFVSCSRGRILPGEKVEIYSVHLQDPLYISLHLQGWESTQGPTLISHESKLRSRSTSLRSLFSERVVQVIFEQNLDNGYLMARHIQLYVPYWICSAGCPPLSYRFLDISERKGRRGPLGSAISSNGVEKIISEFTEEESFEGCTIASAINFKNVGLSLSILQGGNMNFGPIKNMSALGDMDGSLDVCAYDVDKNCFRIFITSKACPYPSVPTKVITLRPFMTFTNRTGKDVYLKLSESDQPKNLHPYDSRVSFISNDVEVSYKLQVRLQDTEWSFPIEISKEDSFVIMLRKDNGCRSFLRVEIRGYEEGSRFLLVFRCGTSSGLIRIENRMEGKKICFRQSGCNDDGAWIQLESFSTTDFSWENPYGHRCIDVSINNEMNNIIQVISLEKNVELEFSRVLSAHGIQIHVLVIHNLKTVRFTYMQNALGIPLNAQSSEPLSFGHDGGSSSIQDENTPMELIIELGVVGISLIDHKPRELLFLYLERVFISYSTGYDAGTTNRFKLILGQVQVDNQLPLTVMPVLLAAENCPDASHPVFKATITMKNTSSDGTLVYPYVYIRVADTCWRINIHEPIIWALVDFYNNIHLDRFSSDSDVMQADPEIRIDLIDVSEIRLKLSVETAPNQRPHGILGIWSPILSAIGNALKIQIHLRKVMHENRFMRKSLVVPSVLDRIRRDLIHDPLHLIFSVDVLSMTKSTFASLSKGFAELSTDGQFLQLRSKQLWSRRITGVSDGILQGTEALAQGVAFGVSGVVTKPIESARQNGLLGFAHGLGRAFLGFIVQPVSGALDFVSLTVDGISASFARCLEILSNKTSVQRIRNPRVVHVDGVIRQYSEKEAIGQMILYLAEASRHIGCTDLFKEPSKYAWSDYYEDHFMIPYHRILVLTNKRIMLLQCLAPDKLDKQPCKIIWDVLWENILTLELAKAGYSKPSHLIVHLINFRKSESFVKLVKCTTVEDDVEESQAVRICSAVRRIWKAHLSDMKTLTLKVPSSQRHVQFVAEEADEKTSIKWAKPFLRARELTAQADHGDMRFSRHIVNFQLIWTSERETRSHCTLCPKQVMEDDKRCSIWRPSCPDGYISIGDIARMSVHPPHVATVYRFSDSMFASPVGYDLVWRNCIDDYAAPVTIWHPRAPEGFVSLGCVAVASFEEPHPTATYCVNARMAEGSVFEDQTIWTAPDSYPWACYIYQVQSEALHFVALRQPKEQSDWKPMKISQQQSESLPEVTELEDDSNHGRQQR